MNGAEVGVRARGYEIKRSIGAARCALNRVVWTSATASGLARCRSRAERVSTEGSDKCDLLAGGDRQALGTVGVAKSSAEVDGPRCAGGGRVGEATAAVDARLRSGVSAASARHRECGGDEKKGTTRWRRRRAASTSSARSARAVHAGHADLACGLRVCTRRDIHRPKSSRSGFAALERAAGRKPYKPISRACESVNRCNERLALRRGDVDPGTKLRHGAT